MKQKTTPILFFIFFFNVHFSLAQEIPLSEHIIKKTIIYDIKGKDTLRMDVMRSNKYENNHRQPCLFFMFPGSFAKGVRNDPRFNTYFNRMTEEGITVISIDYRLGMADTWKIPFTNWSNPIGYISAINTAVEDLYSATLYTINNKDKLYIDSELIMISGSSAGAVTSLQADWLLNNRKSLSNVLPSGFRYKGVLSFAGAVFTDFFGIKYSTPPSPTLFIHGNKDKIVPYNQWNFILAKFSGSYSLANIFKKNKYPYYLITVENGTHSVSADAMTAVYMDRIANFIKNFVINKTTSCIEESM
ncbi:alpha/beta hydrolase [Chryseobacterium sp. Chry.R1]|uniref:alpha/beta hydrolase n=1 Tax=Chryseobacterium sp. Chry.R1 TaxID=3139392 RepID=UPI0031F8D04F